MMRRGDSNRSTTRSVRKCYPCPRNERLPVCPEWTPSEWSRGRELNPRPTDYESVALPLSYPGVSRTCERRGVEFTTMGLFMDQVCIIGADVSKADDPHRLLVEAEHGLG